MDRHTADLTDNAGVVWGLLLLQFVVMGGGLALLNVEYDSSTDLVRMWVPLLLTAAAFVVVTIRLAAPADIGLRSPRPRSYWWMAILLLSLVIVPVIRWRSALAAVPEGQSLSSSLVVQTAVAVALVGFTEEWMFRGLLLTFLSRRLGLRNGVLASTALFGLFHAVNVLGGQSLGDTASQVVATTLIGIVFAMGGLGIRSIVPLMLIHAAYDFFLLSAEQLNELGGEPDSSVIEGILSVVGIATMIAAAVLVARLPTETTSEPYSTTG